MVADPRMYRDRSAMLNISFPSVARLKIYGAMLLLLLYAFMSLIGKILLQVNL